MHQRLVEKSTVSAPRAAVAARRELLLKIGTYSVVLDRNPEIHTAKHLGYPYAALSVGAAQIPVSLRGVVREFFHDPKGMYLKHPHTQLRRQQRYVVCTIGLWRVLAEDGSVHFDLNYQPVADKESSRLIRVIEKKNEFEKPRGMGGTIVTINLPRDTGFILIGDRDDEALLGHVPHQNE